MASKSVREINLAHKGKTGATSVNRRKKRGQKAKPHGKGNIPAGVPSPRPPR